ncbi:NINE protein [Winogradskyella sp.]|jgi:TM2 domain-containing membrane protein YozV|uniref:NINE protein n=1 Tax=Winogradskyella sp. TaxID=1883156 RepID=UPI0025F7F5DF|nr:NINE protein [Winogradskyella sp.]MCT4630678.1 TM2 domain-containing protein [Winogradskyella sp.]
MSDDNKDLGDELNDMIGDAKDSAKKAGEKISQKASDIADDAKEFASDAKETATEFVDNAKETFSGDNKKVLAGILGILLGSLGVHKFILGYNKEGGIMLAITLIGVVLSCIGVGVFLVWVMSVIGLIEGIIYLTKSDQEFINTYQIGKKPWF